LREETAQSFSLSHAEKKIYPAFLEREREREKERERERGRKRER
jgi:hypothetical protein